MQRRAVIWILGAFKTSSLYGIKAIAGLIPIKLYFQKLSGRSQLRAHILLPNHLICSLINSSHSVFVVQNSTLLNSLTRQQHSLIKSYLVDMVNRFNRIFPSFIPLHSEFSPSLRIIDNFLDHFIFNIHNKQKDDKFCS